MVSCVAVDLKLKVVVRRHGFPSLDVGDLKRPICLCRYHLSGVRGLWRRIPYFRRF